MTPNFKPDFEPGSQPGSHPESHIDRILAHEDTLMPSSGFAASVMSAIEQQASAPAPIAFPWKLAIPGIAALSAGIGLILWLAVVTLAASNRLAADSIASPAAHSFDWRSIFYSSSLLQRSVGPLLLALIASYLCVWLARRLAGATSRSSFL